MDKETAELVWRRKILLVAITEQKHLVTQFEPMGLAMPFEVNLLRLRTRLQGVQKRLEEIGYE